MLALKLNPLGIHSISNDTVYEAVSECRDQDGCLAIMFGR